MRANVTRAAEGFDRRSFTVAEILRMQDAGIISDDENFELIEGEIVPMQAKTHDAAQRRTFVHSSPEGRAWRSVLERGPDDVLASAALPGFSARLRSI